MKFADSAFSLQDKTSEHISQASQAMLSPYGKLSKTISCISETKPFFEQGSVLNLLDKFKTNGVVFAQLGSNA